MRKYIVLASLMTFITLFLVSCGEVENVTENSAENQVSQKSFAVQTGQYDIGVIPETVYSCPGDQLATIYMDNEDDNPETYSNGWTGAFEITEPHKNLKMHFCRVDGNNFKPFFNAYDTDDHYAVLKLGDYCPEGSYDFSRYFDNEDDNNQNSSYGLIEPNVVNSNATLNFCLFIARDYNSGIQGFFPDLGFEYGVFGYNGSMNSAHWTAGGMIHNDDEDDDNNNQFSAVNSQVEELAKQIIEPQDGANSNWMGFISMWENTNMYLVKAYVQ